jgi:flagellar protein FlgJ
MISMTTPLNSFSELDRLRAAAAEKDPAAIDTVARQFEGLFAQMLVDSMRQASFGDPLFGDQNGIYRELHDRELAQRLTAGSGLGIAEMLRRQFGAGATQNDGAGTKSVAAAEASDEARLALAFAPAGLRLPPQTRNPAPVDSASVGVESPRAVGALSRIVAESQLASALGGEPDAVRGLFQPAPARDKPPAAAPSAPSARAGERSEPVTPEAFVARIWPHAERAGRALGVDPRLLVAQSALETGWGRKIMRADTGASSHNVFGIKATGGWEGARATQATLEFRDGELRRERAQFRAYDDFGQSFDDYVALIGNSPRYREALAVAHDSRRYAEALERAGYATDPKYAEKLTAIASGPTLNRALAALREPALGEGRDLMWAAR